MPKSDSQSPIVHNVDNVTASGDLVLLGIKAAALLSLPYENELEIFNAVMNEVYTLPVYTVAHIPRSVRPLLSQVLATELQHGYVDGLWGCVTLLMFAKAVLRSPRHGCRKKRHVVKSLLTSRLHYWQEGKLVDLWEETRREEMQHLVKLYRC